MVGFFKHFGIIFIVVAVLIGVTIYSDQIRQTVTTQIFGRFYDVKGISTQVSNSSFSQGVKTEAQKDMHLVQEQVLQIKVQDVVNTFLQGQKIVHDVQHLPDAINEQLKVLAK